MVKSWFNRILPSFARAHKKDDKKSPVPQGLWQSCPNCKEIIYGPDLESNLYVCMNCDHHIRIGARHRLTYLFDENKYQEISPDTEAKDWLSFKDSKKYKDRLNEAKNKIDEKEALLCAHGKLNDMQVVVDVFEFRFMGGSMGSVVGQKFVDAVNKAIELKAPFICFSTSGGARMQESMISLFQMGKTSAAVKKLKKAKQPFISILIDPCYGGVTASLAMLGDLVVAEPKARIGFSGKRVIQDTVKEELPENFQTAEKQLEKGFLDKIVDRRNLRDFLEKILTIME